MIMEKSWKNHEISVLKTGGNPDYACEDGIEKSVPRDHHLSSLSKLPDAYQ